MQRKKSGVIAQLVEYLVYTEFVGGSIPSNPKTKLIGPANVAHRRESPPARHSARQQVFKSRSASKQQSGDRIDMILVTLRAYRLRDKTEIF